MVSMAKPPSRVRYEKSHPVISFRVSQEEHDQFKNLLAKKGQSQREFFKEAIGIQEPKYEKAYNNGFEEAKQKFRIWYYCNVCGEKIWIKPNGDNHKAMIEYMKKEGWRHRECHEK